MGVLDQLPNSLKSQIVRRSQFSDLFERLENASDAIIMRKPLFPEIPKFLNITICKRKGKSSLREILILGNPEILKYYHL